MFRHFNYLRTIALPRDKGTTNIMGTLYALVNAEQVWLRSQGICLVTPEEPMAYYAKEAFRY